MSASSWGGISVKAKLDGLWHDGSPMTHGRFSVCCRLGPAFTVSLIGSAAAGRGDAATAATATIAAAATRLVFLTPMLPPLRERIRFSLEQNLRHAGQYRARTKRCCNRPREGKRGPKKVR